jgi:hypothetical protein
MLRNAGSARRCGSCWPAQVSTCESGDLPKASVPICRLGSQCGSGQLQRQRGACRKLQDAGSARRRGSSWLCSQARTCDEEVCPKEACQPQVVFVCNSCEPAWQLALEHMHLLTSCYVQGAFERLRDAKSARSFGGCWPAQVSTCQVAVCPMRARRPMQCQDGPAGGSRTPEAPDAVEAAGPARRAPAKWKLFFTCDS